MKQRPTPMFFVVLCPLSFMFSFEMPWNTNCAIGSGLDLTRGCVANPVDKSSVAADCSQATYGQACLETTDTPKGTYYTRAIRDFSTFTSEMSTVTEASGAGWGISLSAGVSFAKASQMSENSVSFIVGETMTVNTVEIRTPSAMKLTDAGKSLLKSNPIGKGGFLDQYGRHYVFKVVEGGSFFGGYVLHQSDTSTSSSLGVFANFSANELFFSVGVSEQFSTALKRTSGHVDVYANAEYSGGNVDFNATSPLTMGTTFQQWQDSVKNYPDKLKFDFRGWYDLTDVQEIVNSMGDDVRAAFAAPVVGQTTANLIAQEALTARYVEDSVSRALQWSCVKKDKNLTDAFTDVERKITSNMANIDTLSESDLYEIQEEVEKHNLSWFISEGILTNFQALVSKSEDSCVEYCISPTYPLPLRDQPACVPGVSSLNATHDVRYDDYACPVATPVVTGISLSHEYEYYAHDAQTQVQCAGVPAQAPSVLLQQTVLTNWMWHVPCLPDVGVASVECPVGYAATSVHHTHVCRSQSHDYVRDRYTRLNCGKVNTVLGYTLAADRCTDLDWHAQDATAPQTNRFECPRGSVMTKVSFTHPCNTIYYIYQELWRITCCPLTASFLWCPSSDLSSVMGSTAPVLNTTMNLPVFI